MTGMYSRYDGGFRNNKGGRNDREKGDGRQK